MSKIDGTSNDALSRTIYARVSASSELVEPIILVEGKLQTLISGKTGDSTYQSPRIDSVTHALQTIEYEHHEIHSGSSFTCDFVQDVGSGATLSTIVITPNTTKWLHLVYEIEVQAESEFTIYEGAITGTGTTITIYNRDRNNASTSSTIAQSGVIAITTGTTYIRRFHVGTGKNFGGGTRAEHEIILKQNTKYLFAIANHTTSNNYMSLKLDWYEHTNKSA